MSKYDKYDYLVDPDDPGDLRTRLLVFLIKSGAILIQIACYAFAIAVALWTLRALLR